MHELGIVFHIMDTLEEVARENQLEEIRSVTMEIGEVSSVIPDYLTDCWKWAVGKKPRLSGCEMKVEVLPRLIAAPFCSLMPAR